MPESRGSAALGQVAGSSTTKQRCYGPSILFHVKQQSIGSLGAEWWWNAIARPTLSKGRRL